MESLNNTTWDIVLSGTGLPNSLLALALSRSGKKVLHHDEHEFYGGSEAALSLEEAEVWVERINHEATRSPFQQASITKLEEYVSAVPRLSFSRAYNLCLAPQIIYSRTNLLPALVASKVYKQLEFLAVGNWFIFDPGVNDSFSLGGSVQQNALEPASRPCLRRIPNGREGIVKDKTIDFANKRSLTQLLLMIKDDESRKQAIAENKTLPFTYFLTAQYQLDRRLQAPFHALTLSPNAPEDTTTEYALTRLHRHLSSMGAYGPGFCAVIPRWGGLAEIAQVGCRAGAVGGGVYVLNKGIGGFPDSTAPPNHPDQNDKFLALGLTLEETIYTRRAVGSKYDYPSATTRPDPNPEDPPKIAVRSIAIVTSSLPEMFPPAKAAVHNPAAVMVIFPTGSLSLPDTTISPSSDESPTSETPPTSDVPLPSPPPPAPRNPVPIYLQVRSAETGECPRDQSVIYALITLPAATAQFAPPFRWLDAAIARLIRFDKGAAPVEILWQMRYLQRCPTPPGAIAAGSLAVETPEVAPTFVMEDEMLDGVRDAWRALVEEEEETAEFLCFKDREGRWEGEGEGQGGSE